VTVLIVLAAGASWVAPATAAAAPVWSAPTFLDTGIELADNPGLTGIACPAASECVAVDSDGHEVVFDPADPGGWSAYAIDGSYPLTGVSCASASQCVAVDHRGAEITFDPQLIGAAPELTVIDQGQTLDAVACPSVALCVAVSGDGQALIFDPAAPSGVRTLALGSTPLALVACPSTTQCTALDTDGNGDGVAEPERVVTFDPQTVAIGLVIQLPGTGNITGLSCPTTGECVGAGLGSICPLAVPGQPLSPSCKDEGETVTFDPTAPAAPALADRGAINFLDVACVSAVECTAMDASGAETTFNPSSSGVLAEGAVDPLGDYSKGFNGSRIACPAAGECVLATWNDPATITFAPLSPGTPPQVAIDDGAPVAALACTGAADCLASVSSQPSEAPGPSTGVAVLGSQSHAELSGRLAGTGRGIACPKRTQCTIVGTQTTFCSVCARGPKVTSSAEVTFEPGRPDPRNTFGLPGTKIDKAAISGLACPTARECVAVDRLGREVTFDPIRPRRRSTQGESTTVLVSVSCPSVKQCTAVDGHGGEVTFVPSTGWQITGRQIDGSRVTTAVSCPTTAQCSAVDQSGHEVMFDPQHPGKPVAQPISTAALAGIACPTSHLCVAVSAAGTAASGDPIAGRRWSVAAIPGAGPLLAVACSTGTADCVAGDAIGHVFRTT
jgi:hypothetical protein